MKIFKSILFFLILITSTGLNAQRPNPDYDSTLARKLGANDMGMKQYVLAILKTGPNKMEAGAKRDSLFRGHFSNMERMSEAGKLVIAGPFDTNDKSFRGLFLLNVATVEKARELVQSDPTIREKIFDIELYEWFGSAAISEYIQYDRKIKKTLR